ncbi:MAG: DinB family protein [Acidobacteriota bacterium]|nr:DinB family protein [Acidobacteriota bacterium]
MKQATNNQSKTTHTGAPLVAELETYKEEFEANRRDVRELVAGLDDRRFNWRAAPGRWSVAECLAHLNVTGQVYLSAIDRGIRRARAENTSFNDGPFRHGLFGRLFIRAIEPPAKIKVKAPKLVTPLPEHLLAVTVPAFMSLHEQLIRRLHEANGLELVRIKIVSPVSKLFKFSLGQAFAITAAHERRHLWQARGVRNDPNFPLS